jgi:hypothetical protein
MFYEYCAYICHLLLRGTMCLDQDQKEHKDVNKTLVWHLFCAAYPSTYLAWLRSKNEAYCHKLAAAAWTRISLSSCSRTRAEVSVEEELLDHSRDYECHGRRQRKKCELQKGKGKENLLLAAC